jgi:hypothetical protein
MQQNVTVKIISLNQANVTEPRERSGWGDEATVTEVAGQVAEIIIERDGKEQFGFRILENGAFIIQDLGGMHFEMDVPRGLKLKPSRPWKDEGEESKCS